ncbi:MAG: XdhC family protein, partial [Candidatus Cybelea sp.]
LRDGSACGASLTVTIWRPNPEFAPIAERVAAGDESIIFECASHSIKVPAKHRLVVIGATELASTLTRTARACDFRVTIVDPRPAFATHRRQPHADALIVGWPQDELPGLLDPADAVVVLAHDVKIDLPALRCALASKVRYIGALGNRRTQQARREALIALGYTEAGLARIHGPVGLDLGATTNAQIACSILAEILSVLNDRSALPLRETAAPIGPSPALAENETFL